MNPALLREPFDLYAPSSSLDEWGGRTNTYTTSSVWARVVRFSGNETLTNRIEYGEQNLSVIIRELPEYDYTKAEAVMGSARYSIRSADPYTERGYVILTMTRTK